MDRPRHFSIVASVLALSLVVAACGSESSAADDASDAQARTAASDAGASGPSLAPTRSGPTLDPGEVPEITVYKAPTCGCCGDWIEHLREEGFEVKAEDRSNREMIALKNTLGIPNDMRSCHTAMVGKYLVEGHVPGSDIQRLVSEKPQVAGLAVPGMPVGSPGMEVPGREADSYDVVAFDGQARTAVFESY